jgi:hypothetical protein
MHKLEVVTGILVLLLLLNFNLMPIYAIAKETITDIELIRSDIYEFTKEYYTFKETKEILGVKVTTELDTPKILIDDEDNTLTFKVKVGNAPSDWRLY